MTEPNHNILNTICEKIENNLYVAVIVPADECIHPPRIFDIFFEDKIPKIIKKLEAEFRESIEEVQYYDIPEHICKKIDNHHISNLTEVRSGGTRTLKNRVNDCHENILHLVIMKKNDMDLLDIQMDKKINLYRFL